MVQFYLIPSWFFEFGLVLELIFGFITLAVSLYSFKVYKYSKIRACYLFGWAFFAFSLSYFSWAAVSWYVPILVGKSFEGVFYFSSISSFVLLGVYFHMTLFLLGVITLAYMTLGVKSNRVYTLVASLALIAVLFSGNKLVSFYFVSSLLLLYVLFYQTVLKRNNYSLGNVLVFVAFVFLFLGTIDFTFSAVHHINYVVGHIFYLIGYLFLLANFVLMFFRLRKNE